eukprot:5544634-Karenia_brevis.AAC.1
MMRRMMQLQQKDRETCRHGAAGTQGSAGAYSNVLKMYCKRTTDVPKSCMCKEGLIMMMMMMMMMSLVM